MAACSLCKAPVIYAKTAASLGKASMPVNAEPDPKGQCWFVKMTNHKGVDANLLMVSSAEHPRPERGRFFRQHLLDCQPYKTKKRIEAAMKKAMKAEEA